LSWTLTLAVLSAALFVLLVAGVWTAFALSAAGLFVLNVTSGTTSFAALGSIVWNSNNNLTLTAVPLFIFMGQVILASGVSEDFFLTLDAWMRWVPGRLLPGSVLACGVFAATTGSSVATAAAVGSVAMPEMKKRGYDMPLVAATVAAGGTLGILIPPSIALILYSALENVPVTQVFAAGLIPGVILAGFFMVYLMVRALVNPRLVGAATPLRRNNLRAVASVIPVAILVGFVLGSIYGGIATPTEAGAMGALGAILVSVGRLGPRGLYRAATKAIEATTMVLSIMLGAQLISFALLQTRVSQEFTNWVVSLGLSRIELLVLICLLYVLLGDFVEGIGMMLITLPILFPIVIAAGFNPIWFGVIIGILIELGQITPPVGLNLFVIRGFDDSVPHSRVVRSALPFAGIMLAMIALLTLFPHIALWLADRTAR
jgi:C4-dicarboxylate transporter, DctM subunit